MPKLFRLSPTVKGFTTGQKKLIVANHPRQLIMIKKISTKKQKTVITMQEKYRTRYGRQAKILTTTFKNERYPVIALVSKLNGEDEILVQYTIEGKAKPFDKRPHLVGFDLVEFNSPFKMKA